MSAKPTVLEVLRRFLPAFLAETPTLSPQQWRAIWAINHCRTSTLGADAFFCKPCNRVHLAYHSCNHKACPQCGHADTAAWIQREWAKRINAPYFLVYLPHLQAAFRDHMRRLLEQANWQVDPIVWTKDWGVHIQPAGSGVAALKYLDAYVRRTAITDRRIVGMNTSEVSFQWKDRENNCIRILKLPGVLFVRRYLRHVLPRGLRSVRYYGFCHPAAKLNRMRLQFETGMPLQLGATGNAPKKNEGLRCSNCGALMQAVLRILPPYQGRAPPQVKSVSIVQSTP